MDIPPTSQTAPAPGSAPREPIPRTAKPNEWRKPVGIIISLAAILAAIVLTLVVWNIMERHPRTDDAVARANVVGIAPRVRGQIIKLNVQDNQAVAAGDVLFEIDPEDYQLACWKRQKRLWPCSTRKSKWPGRRIRN